MKIKYLSGKKVGTEAEIDDVQAKGLIEDGIAEAVVEKNDAVADFEKALDSRDAALKADFRKEFDDFKGQIGKAVGKARPQIVVGADRVDSDPQAGFKSVGDYLNAVVRKGKNEGYDERLARLTKTVNPANESTGSQGGDAVPVQYADFLFNDIMDDEDSLISRVFQIPISIGNSIVIPCDNTTTLGSSGIVAAVVGEGVSITDTRPVLRQVTFVVKKLATLVDVTEELLTDTNVALPAYLSNKTEYAFQYAINSEFLGQISGTQLGFGLGVTGHAATAVVAKDSGQAAASLSYTNICNMRKQFYGNKKNACWTMGPDVEAALMEVVDPAGRNIYFPPGGLANSPWPTLFGQPIVVSYHTPALGTVGDITYGDWSRYFVATKGGMDSASTPFLHFDQQLMTFRTTFRLYGQPERAATLASQSGLTLSPFVQLATRS